MNEEYLCVSCKACYAFFSLFCSVKDEECPVQCTECEYYEEAD